MLCSVLLGLRMKRYGHLKLITMNSVKTQVSSFCPGMAKEMCSYLACHRITVSIPKEKEGLMIHPALPVNKSNFNIVGCIDSTSKCKCWIFHLGRMMNY